ncbi:MAG: DUF799 family lipoprotein [Desulfobacterales bacterium]|nr:DUF799 family lipoprotein [Desulfobacterales bacterium]
MMRIKKIFLRMLIVLLCLNLPCCYLLGKKEAVVSKINETFNGTFEIDPYMEKHMPRTVAVLPFVNISRSQKGTDIVRRGFYNHFSSLPFADMELFRVDHELRKAGLYEPDEINKIPPEKFKEILNVDAVIYGTISNFDKLFAGMYSQVSAGAEIKMYDTKGHFLWSGKHVAKIHEGGIPTTPLGIVSTIIYTSLNIRDVQLLRACDDLFRDMVKTIPVKTFADASRPPIINILVQDSKGLPKKAGDEIKVVIKGDPGMLAWFDIGDYKKGIDMKEVEPGGYVGTYRVVPGDNINETIIGYLSDDSGNTSKWIDAIGSVSFDTIPPDPPKNTDAAGRDSAIFLTWLDNKETDLSVYAVYRSETPLSNFKRIGQTEFTNFEDEHAENLKTYFYKIAAVDKAGNESRNTGPVKGIAIPTGPICVSGNIDKDTVWFSGASPYIIEDTVIISELGSLTIEPGTRIESKGKGIVVKGSLIAKGQDSQHITFASGNNEIWEGITFDNVKSSNNILSFCRINGAAAGVYCNSSSPEIRNCEFVKNTTGLKVSGGFSSPTIEKCIIRHNSVTGIEVIDESKPLILENKIKNNDGIGLLIKDAGSGTVKGNTIINNHNSGIVIKNSQPVISNNNIYDNIPFDMQGPLHGKPLDANDNWWGKANWQKIINVISGRINIDRILDGPLPNGKSITVPVLKGTIGGIIDSDSFLSLSNSPYRLSNDLIVDKTSNLYIQPGVKILFDKKSSIIVKDGRIVALGTKDNPIIFTSSGSSPSPGDYINAVFFSEQTKFSSFFKYCKFEYATTAINIYYGMPEITYCCIVNNSQSGIRCGNDAAPRILYNTITKNFGTSGIECRGMANPKINYNNIVENIVAIQAFSTICFDARNNFWGKVPPDETIIMSENINENINIKPWLTTPHKEAFLCE